VKLVFPWLPTQMILPSGWTASAVPLSPSKAKPAEAMPPVPKFWSSRPFGR
jgi:hypothetical protein